jgi:hypothetical protein
LSADPIIQHVLLNASPVAVNDTTSTPVGTPLTIPVAQLLSNDNDLDGHELYVIGIGPTQYGGTATLHDNGTPDDPSDDYIEYTSPPGWLLENFDTFTYAVSDGHGGISGATVTVWFVTL